MHRSPLALVLILAVASAALAQTHPGKSLGVTPYTPPVVQPGVSPGPMSCPTFDTSTLCIPLDGTFSVVVMDGTGGAGAANPLDPCQFNDDDISTAIPLQFGFELFGTTYTEIYVNNNGNCTFGNGLATFTPFAFPSSPTPILAPFFGDVDTSGGINAGLVWFRSEANRFVVTWDNVAYFNENTDKLNTFQLIISDGTDSLVGIGNNVCFCFGDMNWTTGDASGGTSGFGGTAATVGVNAGDGTNSFNIGRFDHAGIDYDGPGGNIDGVDFLDGQVFCFDVGVTSPNNVPPIAQNVPAGNKLDVLIGTPQTFTITFIPPEVGQGITSITATDFGAGILVCDPPVGIGNDVASITCTVTCSNAFVGLSTPIQIVATDGDLMNPLSTTVNIDVCCAECFMLIGTITASQQIGWNDTLLVNPFLFLPMTLEQLPSTVIPDIAALMGVTFYSQAALYNPEIFPSDYLKLSPRLATTIGVGSVIEFPGLSSGLTITPGNDGVPYMPGDRFTPEFSIIGF
ncbi:MAG: nidogen-like domain-containing protein [Planctomycetota bacterium]